MSVDLAAPTLAALRAATSVTSELQAYAGSYPIFTRVPVPDDAPDRVVVISPTMHAGEEDGINDQRPVLSNTIATYDVNDPQSSANYRAVERIAFAVQQLFHRNRTAITVSGWSVVDITARGPAIAPVDDEQTVGRMVTVTYRLARHN